MNVAQRHSLSLSVLSGVFSVCRTDSAPTLDAADFSAVTVERDEWTVVCREDLVPAGVTDVETGWIVLRADGPFEFTEVGVLASFIGPLATVGVSVYALSTFATDYVLIKQAQKAQALDALRAAGHVVEDLHP